MDAIELAEKLHIEWRDDSLNYDTALEASFMLREQHEAIVKLREALGDVMKLNNGEPEFVHAFKVLNETMGIAK